MPYRIFNDSTGNEWQVWDVVPQLTERREGEAPERRVRSVPIEFADRRRASRRLSQARRAILRGTYSHGWLCFDNGKEKRRLTPIPGDWTTCSNDLMEAYVRHAERASGTYAAISDAELPIAETG